MNAFSTKTGKKLVEASVGDSTGGLRIIWFNQHYLLRVIKAGDTAHFSGKIDWFLRRLVMQSPEYEIINGSPTIHTGRLVPIYPETRGILPLRVISLVVSPVKEIVTAVVLSSDATKENF